MPPKAKIEVAAVKIKAKIEVAVDKIKVTVKRKSSTGDVTKNYLTFKTNSVYDFDLICATVCEFLLYQDVKTVRVGTHGTQYIINKLNEAGFKIKYIRPKKFKLAVK